MRLVKTVPIIFLIFINSCNSVTEPEISDKLLITDYFHFAYDSDYLGSTRVLDLDLVYSYHIEGTGGQLIKYSYSRKNLLTKVGYETGWSMQSKRSERNRIPVNFIEEDLSDTLVYSELIDISNQDTIYQEYKFFLKGFYSESSFLYLEDTINLTPFEYTFLDTIVIIN